MKPKNRDEKRHRRERTAARKRKERFEYREKYKDQNQREIGLRDYNRQLESGVRKNRILFIIILIWTLGLLVFSGLSVALWPEFVFLNLILWISSVASVVMLGRVFANLLNRCQFFISLAERPSVPSGVRIPPAFRTDRVERICVEDIFEEIDRDNVFTYCSAKRIEITNDPRSLNWLILFISFLFLLYFSLDANDSIWTPDSYMGLFLCLICLIFSVFLYVYSRKKVFIINREEKTITIPPLSSFGKSKVVPYQQAVVAFCSGVISIRSSGRNGTITPDYLSLTAKEDLPFGPSIGFRCDSGTQYRFALLICKYMNVPNLDDMPDIEGFEDVINRIKAK